MADIVVCHGAWGGSWAWRRMRAPLRAKGHELFAPTYSGLGDRFRFLSPSIGLSTHIEDVAATIFHEDLRDIVLIGHSYGGMVATGVADRETDRIREIIYLDAFVPEDGQSAVDFQPLEERERLRKTVNLHGAGWLVPPSPLAADLSPATAEWLRARRMPQPLRTFEEPIRLTGAAARLPRSYIYCTDKQPGDVFASIAARIKTHPSWRYREIDSGHTPNMSAPDQFADLLDELIAAGR
jgi:pimeloyl-ACP methyl ester carboxylesterase